jgi:hypothetical protein
MFLILRILIISILIGLGKIQYDHNKLSEMDLENIQMVAAYIYHLFLADTKDTVPKIRNNMKRCRAENKPVLLKDDLLVFHENIDSKQAKAVFEDDPEDDVIVGMYSRDQMKIIYKNQARFDDAANMLDEALDNWLDKTIQFHQVTMQPARENKLLDRRLVQKACQRPFPKYAELLSKQITKRKKELGIDEFWDSVEDFHAGPDPMARDAEIPYTRQRNGQLDGAPESNRNFY